MTTNNLLEISVPHITLIMVENIVSRIFEIEGTDNVAEIAERFEREGVEITSGALYNARRRKSASINLISEYCLKRNVSADWLILGRGEPKVKTDK